MTISLYSIHYIVGEVTNDSHESFAQCTIQGAVKGVLLSIFARSLSLISGVYTVGLLIERSPRYCIKIGALFFEGTWREAIQRVAFSISLLAMITIHRIGYSIVGIISPELANKFFEIHKICLGLGLLLKAQYISFPSELRDAVSLAGDQTIRFSIASRALARCLHQTSSQDPYLEDFRLGIWRSAIADVFMDQTNRTFCTENTSSPMFSLSFNNQIVEFVHTAAMWLFEQRLYTQDEIEDMVTALAPVFNIALMEMVEHCLTIEGEGSSILCNGRRLNASFGNEVSFHPRALLPLIERYQDLTPAEREEMRWHLCADEERVRAQRPEFGEMSQAMKNFFLEVVRFRVQILERHMGESPQRLMLAFQVQDTQTS